MAGIEGAARLFSIGIPIFAVLALTEKLYGYFKGNDTVPWMDALSSSYSGITFVARTLLGYSIAIIPYAYMVQHIALIHIENTLLLYAVSFIVIDFNSYWGHRLVHEINFLWNRHLIHHSSEEFNLACALRQSIGDVVNFLFFLSIPSALLGISPAVIAVVIPLHKLAQYWYHTRQIGKLGFLEHVLVTPSHHRVHHALNPLYLDKNYSAVFIVWDKLFGTFQAELDDVPPVYGITRPVRSFNPITINFDHLFLMFKDAWRAEKWMDKLTIWVRPTGWRPEGFEEKYPVVKITDPYHFEKFHPQHSKGLVAWSSIQFFILLFTVIYIMRNMAAIGPGGLFSMAILVFVQVYSATELMNHNKWAPVFAVLSTLVCTGLFMANQSWFGMAAVSIWLPLMYLAYFVLQSVLALWFTYRIHSRNILQLIPIPNN
ncbi:MAG: sterol desaturase family protein [Chitinophagales bacterium]